MMDAMYDAGAETLARQQAILQEDGPLHLTDRNEEELLKQRRDFGVFFKEHDRRRETDFKKVYPELADFFEQTQTIEL